MTDMADSPTRTGPWEMKPSDAIRIGIRYLPGQSFGFQPDPSGERSGCAVDAMMMGYGLDGPLPAHHPYVDPLSDMDCPLGCTPENPQPTDFDPKWGFKEGSYIAAHLNDTHRWTREAIAEWLEEQGL